MLFTSTELVCPAGKPGGNTTIIDLKEIKNAESRIQDVRIANPGNSAELLSCYITAWHDLNQLTVRLMKEHNDAIREAHRVKAVIIFDEVPKYLKAREMWTARSPAGSEDLREAVLNLSPEYRTALERVDEIAAILDLLKGKLNVFKMAYDAVKKILSGDTQGNFLNKVSPEVTGYNGFGVPK